MIKKFVKRIFISLFVFVFYLFWLPITLIKDLFSVFYIPFDINRFLKTYQGFMNNVYGMTNFHIQLEEKADEIGKPANNCLYKRNDIGFNASEDEEYYEEDYE